jgi:plasmid maintenance system antidote protein VapI
MLTGQNKINLILDHVGIKAPTFAKHVGVKYQRILDIQNGKVKNISAEVASRIIDVYPQFNIEWLLTGEGEMLNSETKEPNSNEEDMQMKELIAAFRENREMLAEALDQNSRLIGVIERMQGIDRSATGVQKSPPPRISHRNRVNFDCNKEYDKIIYLYNKRVKPS